MRISSLSLVVLLALLFEVSAFAVEHTKDSLAKVRENVSSGKAILVDVRERDEWDEGHLHDAMTYPLSRLTKEADSGPSDISLGLIKKKTILYCHCRSGFRALEAGKIYKAWGFDVRPLKAGYDDLVKAGFKPAKKAN